MPSVVDGDYEWDSEKAASNLVKHGVTFAQAIVALEDPASCDGPDLVNPSRIVTIGFEPVSGVLVVVSTDVADRIRIISARPADRAARRAYRNNQP